MNCCLFLWPYSIAASTHSSFHSPFFYYFPLGYFFHFHPVLQCSILILTSSYTDFAFSQLSLFTISIISHFLLLPLPIPSLISVWLPSQSHLFLHRLIHTPLSTPHSTLYPSFHGPFTSPSEPTLNFTSLFIHQRRWLRILWVEDSAIWWEYCLPVFVEGASSVWVIFFFPPLPLHIFF